MRSPLGLLVFIAILLLMDWYIFQSIKYLLLDVSPRTQSFVIGLYWGIAVISVMVLLTYNLMHEDFLSKKVRTYMLALVIGLFIAKFVAVVIFFIDDCRRFVQWAYVAFFDSPVAKQSADYSNHISRSSFLSWLGMLTAGSLFGTLVYGFNNKYNYQVRTERLHFPNLPLSFRGLRILHISDIHSGSFLDKQDVAKGIDVIMQQNADLILFTGDLVNNKASEMDEYKHLFSSIKAPMGVYSVLGNHDYGDYIQWPSDGISKMENLTRLKNIHSDMGWRLLLNEHVELKKNKDVIALMGIENWSAKSNFPKYGKMDLAYDGTEKYPFKILMSHDPSHWHGQILKYYKDVDLTLSGHTHGMQFGVELPGFKWSPIQYVYKEWAGLYENGASKLYVNRGFGFLGYPGRVGVLPEITVLELI